jgi:hypothetical protein
MIAPSLFVGVVLLATLAVPAVAQSTSDGWRAEYFGNRHLTGNGLVRQDAEINFDWGHGSPTQGLAADNFSVRWVRNVQLQGGRYRFTSVTDDGVRLFVDGQLVIDQWRVMAPTQFSAELELSPGWHGLRMEYFEAGGGAVARLSWVKVDIGSDAGSQDGWQGSYFANRWLSGTPALTRYDPDISFNWGTGSPDWRLPANEFSVRWTRDVLFQAGHYRFTTATDDGVRLYIDGRLVIDQWRDMPATEHSAEIDLAAGWHRIRMEYYEAWGGATARLWWAQALKPEQPITEWRGEYYANSHLSGAPALIRNDKAVAFDWSGGSPDWRLSADNFSVRWTRELQLEKGLYRFTTQTDDGVRLYVDDRLVIDQWRTMASSKFSGQVYLTEGKHTIRMEYFERTGQASARLEWEGPLSLPKAGNLVTRVPAYPSYSWIKVYQLMSDNTWRDINPRGWASLRSDGLLKIDGLPVDYGRYGQQGHPYRVEQWVDGRLTRSVGDILRGQAEFRIRANADNYTPW